MSIIHATKKLFKTAEERNWDCTFWFFDLHETILKPNYNKDQIATEFYEHSVDVLQYLSKREDVKIFIYTCSTPEDIVRYQELFASLDIHFDGVNKNNFVKNQGYGFYDDKPYFNFLADDKAGFRAEGFYNEWYDLKKFFKMPIENDFVKPMVFISSPYTSKIPGITQERVEDTTAFVAELMNKGEEMPLSPIVYGHGIVKQCAIGGDWTFWRSFCESFLIKCEKMYLLKLPGWEESIGVQGEIKFALENNIPIVEVELLFEREFETLDLLTNYKYSDYKA